MFIPSQTTLPADNGCQQQIVFLEETGMEGITDFLVSVSPEGHGGAQEYAEKGN